MKNNYVGLTWTGQACRKTMVAVTGLDPWDNDDLYKDNGWSSKATENRINDNYSSPVENCPLWVSDWVSNYHQE